MNVQRQINEAVGGEWHGAVKVAAAVGGTVVGANDGAVGNAYGAVLNTVDDELHGDER